MALPDAQDVKDYLKVETDEEDDLIDGITDSAHAWLTAYFGIPLAGTERTFYARYPREGRRKEASCQLVIPVSPCSDTATITDGFEDEVDAATYTIDSRTGLVDTVRFEVFDNPPYDITVDVGWTFAPDYDERVEPILRQAILWAATDYYRRRNAGVEYEQSGGQVSITYITDEVPPVLRGLMEQIRPKGRAW
jgi:hypothetical protein